MVDTITRISSTSKKTIKKYSLLDLFLCILCVTLMTIVLTELVVFEWQGYKIIPRSVEKGKKISDRSTLNKSPYVSLVPRDAVWQPVEGTEVHVYSAYLERRTQVTAVRIIGIGKSSRFHDYKYGELICRMWLSNGQELHINATVEVLQENHGRLYSGIYIMCPFDGMNRLGAADSAGASITVLKSDSHAHASLTNLLVVVDPTPKNITKIHDSFHVCVKPLHSSLPPEWMLEWVEMNRLLGVTHFHLYNYSITNSTECLINHYVSKGIASLHEWNLPVPEKKIWVWGQNAAMNDCAYRSMSSAGWIVSIDPDELLVPRRARTLQAFVIAQEAESNRQRKTTPSAYIFRNVFFYLFWKDDKEAPEPLITAKKTRRIVKPYHVNDRSKYVVRPLDIVEARIHYVFSFLRHNQYSEVVLPDRGLMHHYRKDCTYNVEHKCEKTASVVDRIAHKFSKELVDRVNSEKNLIKNKCSN